MIRRLFRVTGRVQGVGFRWFTLKAARARKLRGYVRNLSDGSVEVVVEGPGTEVGQLRAEITRGPVASSVHGVEETELSVEDGSGLGTGFDVRH